MQKRSSIKRSTDKDENTLAKDVIVEIVDKTGKRCDERVKNPAAVALGRLGGLKGGKARAEKLSAERKTEIARKASLARWKKGI